MEKGLGFTKPEAIFVVGVLVVVAGLTWVNLQTAMAKARDARRKDDLGWIADTIVKYFRDNQGYPPQVGDNQIGGCGEGKCPVVGEGGAECEWRSDMTDMNWTCGKKAYLKPLKKDPGNPQTPGGDAYRYALLPEGKFAVETCLELKNDSAGKPVDESVAGFTGENCPSGKIFKLP